MEEKEKEGVVKERAETLRRGLEVKEVPQSIRGDKEQLLMWV